MLEEHPRIPSAPERLRHEEIHPAPAGYGPAEVRIAGIALRVRHQIEERQELCRRKSDGQSRDKGETPEQGLARRRIFGRVCAGRWPEALLEPQRQQQGPGQRDDFRSAGQYLKHAGQCGEKDVTSTAAPRELHRQDHPRHPGEGGQMARPHEQVQGESVKSEPHACEGRGKGVSRPAPREKKHAQSGKPQVQQAEGP